MSYNLIIKFKNEEKTSIYCSPSKHNINRVIFELNHNFIKGEDLSQKYNLHKSDELWQNIFQKIKDGDIKNEHKLYKDLKKLFEWNRLIIWCKHDGWFFKYPYFPYYCIRQEGYIKLEKEVDFFTIFYNDIQGKNDQECLSICSDENEGDEENDGEYGLMYEIADSRAREKYNKDVNNNLTEYEYICKNCTISIVSYEKLENFDFCPDCEKKFLIKYLWDYFPSLYN